MSIPANELLILATIMVLAMGGLFLHSRREIRKRRSDG